MMMMMRNHTVLLHVRLVNHKAACTLLVNAITRLQLLYASFDTAITFRLLSRQHVRQQTQRKNLVSY